MPDIQKITDPQKIQLGRAAVNAYRTAHAQLYSKGWVKGIPEAHTPLLEKMLTDLKKQDFNSLDEFFGANEELNTSELKLNPLAKVWE